MFPGLPIPGWLDLLDIALIAGFLWLAIRYFRNTRARPALAGVALLGLVYFFARMLDLKMTASLLQAFFAVVVLVVVVVFQEDIRRVFEQLGTWRRGRPTTSGDNPTVDLLVRSMTKLAGSGAGALVVLPGTDPIERHLEGGIALNGRVSEPLLLSLFDKHSPGHDGAVLLRDGIVERFALHLPLSANHSAIGPGGTRHAAALGLSELCDATCIVVSEERGTLSIARNGVLQTLRQPEDLVAALRSRDQEKEAGARPWWQGRVGMDAVIAVIGSLLLWTVFVPGSDLAEKRVMAKIHVTNLPANLVLKTVEPESAEIVLRGQRRDLLLADPEQVSVDVDAYQTRLGRRTFTITQDNVAKPSSLTVISVEPNQIKLDLESAASP